MLEITIAPEVIAKFKELLVEEDNEDVIDSYGLKYTIAVDEHNMPAVSSELQKASPAPESDGTCSEEKACSLS